MNNQKLTFLLIAVASFGTNLYASQTGSSIEFVSGLSALAVALGVGIAAGGCGVGMGMCIASALQGIARQPENTPKLQMNMMIGLAFIESLVLYALFIAIILLYANPFLKVSQ